ncbi:pirin family protein [Haloglycomyces albus]|uniref:pirin family protein n=1 Tax=Haloglycomyces albus TaxID=526067 RepID=UPI00046D908E|nr:pirin-like C-terminal cupin domain-containing protein [Haloglycomyces albus]
MPAVSTSNILALPRVDAPAFEARPRRVRTVTPSQHTFEGAGFPVRRPTADPRAWEALDPILMLDHMTAAYEPHEAKGAPWHPHRGFETVTYLMDGTFVHTDSHGGGGVIGNGDTQWMTAGSGLLHDELPSEYLVMNGGEFDGIQMWVNLPGSAKMHRPRYQDIVGDRLTLLSSADGGTLIRVIAGRVGEHEGPGKTFSPINLIHLSLAPGAQVRIPWVPGWSAMAYSLHGDGYVGDERRPLDESDMAVFSTDGNYLTVEAAREQHWKTGAMEVVLFGGQPIREPVARYGPFVMNSKDEIYQAIEDFRSGRMGEVPAGYEGRDWAPAPDEFNQPAAQGCEIMFGPEWRRDSRSNEQ